MLRPPPLSIPKRRNGTEFRKMSAFPQCCKSENRTRFSEFDIRGYQVANEDKVILNVGGVRHEILWTKLDKYPDTRLGQLWNYYLENVDSGSEMEKSESKIMEFYFDCNPDNFEAILNLYRRGTLHFVEGMCPMQFTEDLIFWGIEETQVSSCCLLKFETSREVALAEMKHCRNICNSLIEAEITDDLTGFARLRKRLWKFFEDQSSSDNPLTNIFTFMSVFLIILSTSCLVLTTLPEFQPFQKKNYAIEVEAHQDEILVKFMKWSRDIVFLPEGHVLPCLEEICMLWFTVELLLRFFAAPNRCKFFIKWLNVIDILSVLPFYCTILVVNLGAQGFLMEDLMIFRVVRILKLGRYSTGLCTLGMTIRRSLNELTVLLIFFNSTVIIFASLVYICERDDGAPDLDNIPKCLWWAINTVSTVGYGDVVPLTRAGKTVACMAAICSVVVCALPVVIIVQNFRNFHEDHKKRETAVNAHVFLVKAHRNSSFDKTDKSQSHSTHQ